MPNKKGQFITSDEAIDTEHQHDQPCSDCPFARRSAQGWLGPHTVDDWLRFLHGEAVIPCHVYNGPQCAGAAIYRANVCKLPMPPNIRLPVDKEKVFATPMEFKEHHQR